MVISNNLFNILACPYCNHSLKRGKDIFCDNCNARYKYTNSGSLNLRLKKRKKCLVKFSISRKKIDDSSHIFGPLEINKNPEIDLARINQTRFSDEMLSYFPKAKTKSSLMLDVGCGTRLLDKEILDCAKFEYVGLDYDSQNAAILADMHALPFKDESFEFIVSFAAMQYSYNPFIMVKEINRVLKRRGKFIGTVAFLEPYHKTFYHSTHLGLLNTLECGGFEVYKISPSDKWSGLIAQAQMGLFPRMPFLLVTSIVFPINLLHKIYWRLARIFNPKATNIRRMLYNTGTFTFMARKR